MTRRLFRKLLNWLNAGPACLCLSVAFFLSLATTLSAQEIALRTNEERQRTVKALREKQEKAKQEAMARALVMGWPVRGKKNGNAFELMAIGANGEPVFYQTCNANAAISTAASLVRDTPPYSVSGSNLTVGVWDEASARTTHQEFGERVTGMDTVTLSSHSTHVAGTIGAAGVSASAKGMAPGVRIDSYDWNSDQSEMSSRAATTIGQAGMIYISSHSYSYLMSSGDPRFGQYSYFAATSDSIIYNAPYYLAFWAVGNDRTLTIKGGYDTISDMACAKNCMGVGSVGDAVSGGVRSLAAVYMPYYSGWGPADDGRIKPDIVANGESLYSTEYSGDASYVSKSGTSMATPNASGSATLLVDYYGKRVPGQAMRASTLKGLIIHTADDLGNAGPDYTYGWGLMNTKAAADQVAAHAAATNVFYITEGLLLQKTTNSFRFQWNGTTPVRATLCWTDPAGTGTGNTDDRTPVLVNDLDIRIIAPDGTTTNFPYVLDVNNPANAATTGDNIVDNVEQVRIASPVAGWYTLAVTHKGTTLGGSQQYYSLFLSGQLEMPVLSGAGATLAAEGFTPANNAVDSSETVTVNLALRNTGSANATNLTATLLSTAGVISLSAPQNYGVITAGGPTVSCPFTFIATGTCGSAISAVLKLQDGIRDYDPVTNIFILGKITTQTVAIANTGTISIPTSGSATPYPSTISVSGITDSVSRVTVTLTNLVHQRSTDINILLVGPGGQKALLMSGAGGANAINATLGFDMDGPVLPQGSAISSGTYAPTNYNTGVTFNSPAPAGPHTANFAVFNNVNPNGTWSLYIMDSASQKSGSMGGWQLNITTIATNCSTATQPVLVATPPSCNFGTLAIGQASNMTFSVLNIGVGTLTGSASAASPFSIASGSPFSVGAGQSGLVTVAFSPLAAGIFSTNVVFASNGGNFTNALTGVAVTPGQFAISPSSYNFGSLATGTSAQTSFTVTNTGGISLNGTAATTAPFSIASGASFTVGGYSSTNVVVSFTPAAGTSYNGSVIFAGNGGNSTNALSGTGTTDIPVAGFTASPISGDAPLTVTFIDASSGSTITNRSWSFGDGATTNITATSVQHTYLAAGGNTVRLIVSGLYGVSTNTKPNHVAVSPPVAATWTNSAASGDWSTAGNWNPACIPDGGTTVTFGGGGTTCVVDGVSRLVGSIVFNRAGNFVISSSGGAGLTVTNGISVASSYAFTLATPVVLGNSNTWTVNTGGSLSAPGTISGSALLAKDGPGVLTLAGANTYSGGTTLSAGSLNVNNAAALGTGPLTIGASGVTLDNTSGGSITISGNNAQNWNGDFTFAGTQPLNLGTGTVTISGDRTVTITSNTLLVGGGINGSGLLTKAGSGTLVFGTSSTYSGGTIVNAGSLVGTAYANMGGTIYPFGAGTLGISSGATVTVDNSSAGNYNYYGGGAISGSGAIVFIGNGMNRLIVDSVNFAGFTGTITIAGTGQPVEVDGAGANTTAAMNINSGAVLYSRYGATYGALLGSGFLRGLVSASTVTIGNGGGNGAFSGVIENNGNVISLTKIGSGTQVLSGLNTYSGATLVSNGKLVVNGSIGSGTVTVGTGTTLGGKGVINGPVTVNGTLSPGDATGTLTVSNNLTCASGAVLQYALGASNSLCAVTGNLALSGALNVTDAGGFGVGTNTLFTYAGSLSGSLAVGTTPNAGYSYSIDTNTAGQVKLLTVANTPLQQVTPASLDFGTIGTNGAASLSFTVSNLVGQVLTGTATVSAGPFSVSSGSPYSVAAGTSTNVTIQFAPSSVGIYTTNVIFAGNGGNSTNTVTGICSATPVVASFTGMPTTGLTGLAVTFTNTSTGPINNCLWSFGDGISATTTALSVSHTYTSAGTCTVGLTVYGAVNTNTLTRSSYISVSQPSSPTWTNNSSSATWSVASNWNPSVVPDGGVDAIFGVGSAACVVDANRSIGTLLFNYGSNVTLSATNGAGLTINNGITASNSFTYTVGVPLTLGGSNAWQVISGGTLAVSGSITGSAPLTKIGTGTLTLGGTNSYTGGTTLSAGILDVGTTSALGSSSGTLTVNGGTLQLNSYAVGIGALNGSGGTIDTGTGALTSSFTGSQTFGGTIINAGSLNTSGTGTLTLTGNNTYTGATTVNAGTLVIANSSGTGLAAGSSVGVSGGNLLVSNSGGVGVAGPVTVSSGTLSGTGTLSGSVTINSGGHGSPGNGSIGTINAGSLTLASGSYLDFDITNPSSLDQIILSTSGALVINGGTLTINGGASRFTTVGSYNLIQYTGAGGAIGGTGTLSVNSANVDATRAYSFTPTLISGNNYWLTLTVVETGAAYEWHGFGFNGTTDNNWDTNNNWLPGGPVADASVVNFGIGSSSGTLNMNGVTTAILAGIGFHSSVATTLAGTGTLTLGNGAGITVEGGNHTISSGVTVALGGNSAIAVTGGLTVAGTIASGGIVKEGGGTLTLNKLRNTYSGGTTVNAGNLVGIAGSWAGDTISPLGTGTLSISSGATVTVDNSPAGNYNYYGGGAISGSGNIVFIGNGVNRLIVDSVNFSGFTGTITIAGTGQPVEVDGAGANTTAAMNINSGAVLFSRYGATYGALLGSGFLRGLVSASTVTIGNGGGNGTFSGVIENNGNVISLTKIGSGTQVLSGLNTYSGATLVSNGKLEVNGSIGSGTVTVNTGAILGGKGVINGPVTVNGALSPGDATGTLTVSNNLTCTSGAVLQYALGASNSLCAVTGNLVLSGTLNVTDAGGFGAGTNTLFTYTGSLSGSLAVGTTPNAGYSYSIDTNTAGQVKLVVSGNVAANYTLNVTSLYGGAFPGTSIAASGTVFSCSVTNSPVMSGSTQYVCTGWTMSGHEPASGSGTNFTMTITNNAALVWRWATNYWIELNVTGN